MGDRANVAIIGTTFEQHDGKWVEVPVATPIVFYTHSCGHELPGALAAAIKAAEPRWTQSSYAARIILHNLLVELGADPASEYGFGIGTELTDNEYPIFVVDLSLNMVGVVTEAQFREGHFTLADCTGDVVPFAEATAERLNSIREEAR